MVFAKLAADDLCELSLEAAKRISSCACPCAEIVAFVDPCNVLASSKAVVKPLQAGAADWGLYYFVSYDLRR